MINYLYERYPQYIGCIQSLLQYDPAFREICADYEEICAWLDNYKEVRPPEEYDRALDLMRDLEGDINKALKGAATGEDHEHI